MRIAHVKLHSQAKYSQDISVRGHQLKADESTRLGGADSGPAPYELLLSGLGACTAITLRMYAERKGWELGEVDVDLTLEKSGEEDRIARTVRFSAPLTDEQRQRLAEIAEKTPVTKTIKAGAKIETTFA